MKYLDFNASRQTGTTTNGIRVVVYTIPNRPIALTAAFNVGRRYDPDDLECLSHMLEHMVVAGSRQLPSKDRIAAYIERLGGSIAARTELSSLLFKLTIGRVSDFGAAVYLLDQLLVHSLYDEITFVKEAESVRQELAALQASPGRYVERLFIEHLFGSTRLGRKTMDNQAAINRATIGDIREWSLHLRGKNLAIILAGGITIEEAIAQLGNLSLDFGSLPMIKPEPINYRMPKLRIVDRYYDTSSGQVELAYGFPSHRAGHPDNPALTVLTALIGGGRASSLSRLLRYEAGLVYSVRAENSSEIGCGAWVITTGTDSANLATVLKLINDELQRAIDGGITAEELALAKATLINSAPVRFDSIPDFLKSHVLADLHDLPDTSRLPGQLTAIEAVGLDDITRVARDIFRPHTSVLTLCGAPVEISESALF